MWFINIIKCFFEKIISHKALIFAVTTYLLIKEHIHESTWLVIAIAFFTGKVLEYTFDYFIKRTNGQPK